MHRFPRSKCFSLLMTASLAMTSTPLFGAYDPLDDQTNRWAWWFSGVLLGGGAGVGVGYAIADNKKGNRKSKKEDSDDASPITITMPASNPSSSSSIDRSTELAFFFSADGVEDPDLKTKITLYNPSGVLLAEKELQEMREEVLLPREEEKILGAYCAIFEVLQPGSTSGLSSLGTLEVDIRPEKGQPMRIFLETEQKAANAWTVKERIVRYFSIP